MINYRKLLDNLQKGIDKKIQDFADAKAAQAAQNGIASMGQFEPVLDGILNTCKFIKSTNKILVICKEANSPNDGGWNYREIKLCNDMFFGLLNRVAKGILYGNTDYEIGEYLGDQAPIYEIAFTNISNLPGGSVVGLQGTLYSLYIENSRILEAKLRAYSPDTIICGNVCELIWPSIVKALDIEKNYTSKYFSENGEQMSSGYGNSVAVYYCTATSGRQITVIDAYHPRQRRISKDNWVLGIVNAEKNKPKCPTIVTDIASDYAF